MGWGLESVASDLPCLPRRTAWQVRAGDQRTASRRVRTCHAGCDVCACTAASGVTRVNEICGEGVPIHERDHLERGDCASVPAAGSLLMVSPRSAEAMAALRFSVVGADCAILLIDVARLSRRSIRCWR